MQEEYEKTQEESILHSWKIAAHEERERTGKFYLVFFATVVLLLVFTIWQKNFLFGVFVLLSAGTILFLSGQRAEVYEFTMTDSSIIIGDQDSEFAYSHISHFDMHAFSDTDRELFIIFKEKFKPVLRIRYYKGDENTIRDILLSKKIPQKKIEPSLLDYFSKIVGI